MRMNPVRTADTKVPMMWVSWIFHGVAPTRTAVFMSWDKSPDKEIAMQTMAPPMMAALWISFGSWPRNLNRMVIASKAVIVMPETGELVAPIKPTMRADTATKKKQNATTTMA